MGVHDVDKYPEIKRLLGIPEDEPIFIFRAQDFLMEDVVRYYQRRYTANAIAIDMLENEISRFTADLDADMREIAEWQKANADRVKVPD